MSEWNIKVEMNQNCCEHLISRYYDGIEAETLEQAEEIAYHRFIDTLENSIVTESLSLALIGWILLQRIMKRSTRRNYDLDKLGRPFGRKRTRGT